MRATGYLHRLCIQHPTVWGVFAVAFFSYVSRLPINSWSVEILIARNVLRGHGFVVGPMDPPALWRPPLSVLVLLPIEAAIDDPKMVYKVSATLFLTAATIVLFYVMKQIAGIRAAHFSQLFAFTLPMFITAVNRHFTLLSYLLMLVMTLAAILLTLRAWTRHRRVDDGLVGLAWGLAFLSRPETITLFGVTLVCSFFVYRRKRTIAGQVWPRLVVQAACFLLIYIPSLALFRHLQTKHDLIGQEALVTYYAGEYLAWDIPAGDRDGQGYAATVRRFGEPSAYRHSLLLFAWEHPRAVLTRIKQNIRVTVALFSLREFVNLPDWLVFVLFGALLAKSTPPVIPGKHLLLYSVLLSCASTYFLIFHTDPRYLFAFMLMLFWTVQVIAILLWREIGKFLPDTRTTRGVSAACAVVLISVFVLRVSEAAKVAKQYEVDLRPFRDVAALLRASIGPEGTPAVGFIPPDSDAMWISYFANTSIPWHVDSAVFPRDRIYSFINRAEDYMLVPTARPLADLGNPLVLWRYRFPRIGDYMCVDMRQKMAGSN